MELGVGVVNSFSAEHPLSLGVLDTRPEATCNIGAVRTYRAPGT